MNSFIHLHLHTQFSLLNSTIKLDPLFELAKQYNMSACAITDLGNMFGVVDFYLKAKESGIKPIIGCEARLPPESPFTRKTKKGIDPYYHIVLLAMNNQGYRNLMKLVSSANMEGFYDVPRTDKEILRIYNEGLICLTACDKGEIPRAILKNDEKKTKRLVEEYYDIFGERLYFELQNHNLKQQEIINKKLIELSSHYGISCVATNNCHYLKKEEAIAHELLLCIQTGKTLHDKDRLSFKSEEFYFKSPEEMERAFSAFPEAIKNTRRVAEMCNLQIDTGVYHFPAFNIQGADTIESHFDHLCQDGFTHRIGQIRASGEPFTDSDLQIYRERLDYEAGVIKNTGFTSYFLIVADFIDYARQNGIPVGPGRGSAAGSLVAYCLGITDIDPIKYDLLFERFLNPERVSMPDIDVDFCMDRRDEVIQYVTDKYGKDNVAQIITFGTMKSRAVVRDVGRALALPYAEVDRIAKLIPGNVSIEKALDDEVQLKDLYGKDPRIKELLDNAVVLEGLARHASTHAAGIVISNKNLTEYVPLYRGKKGETLTQFPMKIIEEIGLVKMDFLGLETLTVIDTAVKLIKESGVDIDIAAIPLDDQKAYDLLSSGNTSGVFQLESDGMRDLLTKLKPSKFEDIMPLIALYRPGPLNSGMVKDYINRKNNPAMIRYETPKLEEVLKDTYGVIIYQEQIMKIATVLANFSIKDADILRKAMSKKVPEQIEKFKAAFIDGALANGVKQESAEKIYDVILRFGEYGFNKSHSTAYAKVAYQTAYLKANYPVQYMAAILTSQVSDTDKLYKYISECRDAGFTILQPDINRSMQTFTVVGENIGFGLAAIKNVGEAALENIIEIRDTLGGFSSFHQFLQEIDTKKVNKKVIESLIKAGCFDSFGLRRSQLFYMLNSKSDKATRKEGKNGYLQPGLFGDLPETVESVTVPDMEELPFDDILKGEKEAFGFYFSEHPMKSFEHLSRMFTKYDTENVKETESGIDVDIAGLVSAYRELVTKRGDRMAYLSIEDTKGAVEVIVFPDLFSQCAAEIKSDKPLVVTGTVEKSEEGSIKLRAKRVRYFDDVMSKVSKLLRIRIYCDAFKTSDLRRLRDLLVAIPGESRLALDFVSLGEERTFFVPDLRIDCEKRDTLIKHFGNAITCEVANEILS